MTPILVFDIETIPDVETAKKMYPNLAELSDVETQHALKAMRQAEANTDFMRLPLHKIACLSFLWVEDDVMTLKSLSLENLSEAEILNTFFRAFNKKPNLVSWNGSGFDMPVMMYRAMHHKLSAPALMDESSSSDAKYNNYLSRYHNRHLDLMDKLTLYAGYTKQPLDVVAGICGFAGKQDMNGAMVVDLVNNKDWHAITTYCESDVMNTWLVYLRWQRLNGALTHEDADALENLTKEYMASVTNEDGSLKYQGFLNAWQ